jgi:hypothetical protein
MTLGLLTAFILLSSLISVLPLHSNLEITMTVVVLVFKILGYFVGYLIFA